MKIYQVMPNLSAEEYAELKADIRERGVMIPIEFDESGNVLDGHHRLQICNELGITDYPKIVRTGMTEQEKITHARKLNMARRHLTQEQKRELIREQLKETPEKSDRQIAESLGVHHTTVSTQRAKLEDSNELAKLATSKGSDGKEYPRQVERSTYKQVEYEDDNAEIESEEYETSEAEDDQVLYKFDEVVEEYGSVLERYYDIKPKSDDAKSNDLESEIIENDDKKKPHVSFNSGNNEWYTPKEFIEAARVAMGSIDLDPASNDIANEVVKAETYYTAETNGLDKEWTGNVWMNPPYASDLIGKFVDKLIEQRENYEQAIVLVNNATETEWFNKLISISSAVCFPKSRVKFYMPDGKTGAPLQGQAVLYVGKNIEKFMNAFDGFGWRAKLYGV